MELLLATSCAFIDVTRCNLTDEVLHKDEDDVTRYSLKFGERKWDDLEQKSPLTEFVRKGMEAFRAFLLTVSKSKSEALELGWDNGEISLCELDDGEMACSESKSRFLLSPSGTTSDFSSENKGKLIF